MSIVINSVLSGGRGFSANTAIVRVVAPTGSAVTMSRGAVTNLAEEIAIIGSSTQSCYYFTIAPSQFSTASWTITAASGGSTASATLVVNAAGEYMVGLSYWDGILYEAGDEKSDATGGWATFVPVWGQTVSGCSKNAGNMTVSFTTGSEDWKNGAYGTVNLIDMSAFTTLNITATAASSSGSVSHFKRFGVTDAKNTTAAEADPHGEIAVGTTTLDISDVSEGYVWFGGSSRGSGSTNIVITKVWLS